MHNATVKNNVTRGLGHEEVLDTHSDQRRSWIRTGRLTALEYPSLNLNHKWWVEPLVTTPGAPAVCQNDSERTNG